MIRTFQKNIKLNQSAVALKFNRIIPNSIRIILISIFIFSMAPSQTVFGQSGDGDWGSLVNISNSGATENPVLIKGNSGKLHALWQDEYARFVYRFFEDGWSPEFSLDLPFYGYGYKAIVDQTGLIYFFWIDETNNNLYFTRVNEELICKQRELVGFNTTCVRSSCF